MLDTILFDLDGTLLPLNMEKFIRIYFDEMGQAFQDLMNPKILIKNIWEGTEAMMENLEQKTNEEVFMKAFSQHIDKSDLKQYQDRFDNFYDHGFMKTRQAVQRMPLMQKAVQLLKEKGYNMAIATNPVFPKKAILHRIDWAGLNSEDFSYISSYEKNCYCKPHLEFYWEILHGVGKTPYQCMMVGNDVQEDLIAGKLGMETFLITDYLINKNDEEIHCSHMGSYEDFYQFAEQLAPVK